MKHTQITPLFGLAGALLAWLTASPALAECRTAAIDVFPERSQVYLPETRPADAMPMPLVLLLHGSMSDGAAMMRASHLADTADRHGFIVVAPNGGLSAGHGYVWNIPGVPTVTGALPPERARDDVKYLAGLIDRLIATGCVDEKRVYATGLSGGGRMTSWLGCVDARRFAAIAPVVGLRAGRPSKSDPERADPATCRVETPLPVMAFSGDADTTNPIAGGGAPYWRYSQAVALQSWAVSNGCSRPYARNLSASVYEQGYGRCRAGATVAARVVRGGRHDWAVVDNEVMWAFLSQYTR